MCDPSACCVSRQRCAPSRHWRQRRKRGRLPLILQLWCRHRRRCLQRTRSLRLELPRATRWELQTGGAGCCRCFPAPSSPCQSSPGCEVERGSSGLGLGVLGCGEVCSKYCRRRQVQSVVTAPAGSVSARLPEPHGQARHLDRGFFWQQHSPSQSRYAVCRTLGSWFLLRHTKAVRCNPGERTSSDG